MKYISASVLALCASIAHAQDAADLVLRNAFVLTMDKENPEAQAVAVRGNQIVYVGDVNGVESLTGENTEVLDLTGKMVLPGYVSAHDHVLGSAWSTLGVDLNAAKDKEETLQMLRDYVAENPDLPIVVGQGYNATLMGGAPTAAELDEIIPDKIAIIIDFTIHDAWLNTKALEAGNITKDTPDPVPGVTYWIRDDDGNPLGVGKEGSWFPVYTKVAWDPERMIEESRKKLQPQVVAGGTTTALIPGVVTPNFTNAPGMFDDLEISMKVLEKALADGDLPVRTFVQPAYKDATADPVEFAARARAMADKYNGDLFRVHGIKLHPEGTWSAGAVLMLEPFEGTDNIGISAVKPDQMKEVVKAANDQGLDVFAHVEGSGTVRGMIDAILASRDSGNADERNALHHYQIVHPDDQQRMIDNSIPVNITPIFSVDWAGQDQDFLSMLGDTRTNERVSQYRPLADAGVSVSLAGDYPSAPMSTNSMLYQIYTAVTFKNPLDPANSKKFPNGAAPLDLMQAIEAVTINPAWQLRMEDKLGSLEVGKLADIVILDRNILELDSPEELLTTTVQATIMDGQFRHRDGL